MITGNQPTAIFGDIHGCYATLLKLIAKLPSGTRIISVGDLIDRGPQIEQVVDYFRTNNLEVVLGNHELMAIQASIYLNDPDPYILFGTDWIYNGGKEVIEQYSSTIKLLQDIEYFKSFPICFETRMFYNELPVVVSHAQLSNHFTVADLPIEYSESPYLTTLVWNRSTCVRPMNFFNVHGHTPTDCYGHNGTPILTPYFLNLDTGCCYNASTRGVLTAALFIPEESEIQIIQERRIP